MLNHLFFKDEGSIRRGIDGRYDQDFQLIFKAPFLFAVKSKLSKLPMIVKQYFKLIKTWEADVTSFHFLGSLYGFTLIKLLQQYVPHFSVSEILSKECTNARFVCIRMEITHDLKVCLHKLSQLWDSIFRKRTIHSLNISDSQHVEFVQSLQKGYQYYVLIISTNYWKRLMLFITWFLKIYYVH